jgi:hypothetical protein
MATLASEFLVTPLDNPTDTRTINIYDLMLPYAGNWSCRVEMTGPAVLPDGPVTVQIGAELMRGFVARTGADRGQYIGIIVGGQARTSSQGLHRNVTGQHFWQTPARTILSQTLALVGEVLATDSNGVDTVLNFPRRAVRCDRVLDDLADALGVVWRVKPDGSVWLGADSWPATRATFTYQSKQPDMAAPLLAPDPQQPLIVPGVTVTLDVAAPRGSYEATPQKVTCSRYWADERLAQTRVWLADPGVDFLLDDKLAADRIHSGFAALAVAATRKTDWYRTFQGSVVTQRGDGTLDITLDQVFGQPELPPIRGASISAPVGGAALSFQPGDRVAVYFEGGDFRRPRAAMAEQGSGNLGVARVTDEVGQATGFSTWWPLVKAVAVAFAADPIFATFAAGTQTAISNLAAGQVTDPIGLITSGSSDIKLRK